MKLILLLLTFFCLSCTKAPQTFKELQTAGQNAFIEGDYSSAKQYLNKALQIKPSDRDALYYLGQTFQKLHNDDSAVYYFKRADILFPNNRELNLAIYKSANTINDYENTIKAINVLIKTGDAPEPYYLELANLNLKNGNIIVSFQLLRKIWENGTDSPGIYLGLGNVAVQVDSVDFAIKIIKEAIEKFGEKEQFVNDLAIYLVEAHELPKAEKLLRNYLDKYPNAQNLRRKLAKTLSLYDTKDKTEESLKLYKKIRQVYGGSNELDSIIVVLQQKLQ